ncbi:MAG: hypothetical protein HDQ98_08835 [Lachnospiraceae bacterium]|nr:hypothetical protein [Lachnospiraceae bacterium]
MKINDIGNNFFISNMEKTYELQEVFEKISAKEEQTSVKVSISEEGKNNYRNSLEQQSEGLDNVMEQRRELLSGKNVPETDYSFELGNKLAAMKEEGVYQSTEDKAFDLLKAYASVYDEIVQGYESGTRERYSMGQLPEDGYRKLTMSEEINSLNAAYKKYADFLEVQAQQKPKIVEAYEKYMKQISKIGAEREELDAKAQERYSKIKEEKPLENISEKVVAASKVFAEQYAKQNLKRMGIETILKNIKIFEG